MTFSNTALKGRLLRATTLLATLFVAEVNGFESFVEITSSTAWRIFSPSSDLNSGWNWDIPELKLFDNLECSGSPVDTSQGTPIDSAHAGGGWVPGNAFDNSNWSAWGGRPDSNDNFWLGIEFNSKVEVRCIKLYQGTPAYSDKIRIQAKDDEGIWQDAWIEELGPPAEDGDVSIIPINYNPPTSAPTKKPTKAPTPVSVNIANLDYSFVLKKNLKCFSF